MARCFIGIGSNLGDSLQLGRRAVESINKIPGTHVEAVSPWYGSKAVGPGIQPDYVNAVCRVETQLSADRLLTALQAIETASGRVRAEHWGARTLDLDILLYDQIQLQTDRLNIPHPGITQRSFVVLPLLDLEPELKLPDGTELARLEAHFCGVDCWRLTPDSIG